MQTKKFVQSFSHFFIIPALVFVFLTNMVLADVGDTVDKLKKDFFGLNSTADKSGFKTDTTGAPEIAQLVGQIIGIALSLLGLVFMVLIIYGGFLWMQARGNEEDAKQAKEIVINATIGVVVVFSAYAVSNYIIGSLSSLNV